MWSKLLFWWGLRPLTADILYDEHLRAVNKHMKDVFEDTVVPILIKYGKCTRLGGFSENEAKAMEDLLTKAKIKYQTIEDSYGIFFNISIKE